MKTVLLRLEGPLQSWGTQGRFGTRDTDREPSKSGVVGLVAAAMGVPREDDATIARLAAMRMAVRVDREGVVMRDYHTVGAGTFRGRPHSLAGQKNPAITLRDYLADASFLVGLESADVELVASIGEALQRPTWAPFLGRRACSPSAPIYAGIHDGDVVSVLRRVPLAERGAKPAETGAKPAETGAKPAETGAKPAETGAKPVERGVKRVRLVVDAEDGAPRMDVPVSFVSHARLHRRRFVRTEWIEVSQEVSS